MEAEVVDFNSQISLHIPRIIRLIPHTGLRNNNHNNSIPRQTPRFNLRHVLHTGQQLVHLPQDTPHFSHNNNKQQCLWLLKLGKYNLNQAAQDKDQG